MRSLGFGIVLAIGVAASVPAIGAGPVIRRALNGVSLDVRPIVTPSKKLSVHKGWLSDAEWDRAIGLAEKYHRPIAVLEKSGTSRDPRRNSRTQAYMGYKGFRGFVRVMRNIDQPADSPTLQAALESANRLFSNEDTPRIVCLDAKGRVVEVIGFGASKRKLAKLVKIAAERFATVRILDKKILRGDRLIARGRFRSAVKLYKEVAKRDPEGRFYPTLVEEKMKAINEKAGELLAEAEALLEKGERTQASIIVEPIVRDGGDFGFLNRAKQLRQQIRKKRK